MSKKRYIDTKFWDDEYVIGLNCSEKLLFLYLLTNPITDICGIYEIHLRRISFDTDIDKKNVLKILEKFAADKKVFYINGWVYIKNFQKHQAINESIKQGITRSLKEVPTEILAKIKQIDTETPQTGNTGDTEPGLLTLTPILTLKPTLTPNGGRFTPPTLEEVKKYCLERNNTVDPERFYNFYASKGWMVGKNKMKDWQAAVRTWEKGQTPQRKTNVTFI